MNLSIVIKLKLFFLLLIISLPISYAFRPVAHIVLQRTITQELPKDNIFKIAMDSFPTYAAWGAVGPDLSYVPYKIHLPKWEYNQKLANQMNFADMSHYYKVGTFCKNLIQEAKKSKDLRLVAFAAGWISHVSGDFGAHGIYVYPKAGYYISNKEERDTHGEMEKYADSYIFIEKGKKIKKNNSFYDKDNLDSEKLFVNFFEMPYGNFSVAKRKRIIKKNYLIIYDLLKRVYAQTYNEEEMVCEIPYMMKHYDKAFGKGIGKLKGFNVKEYDDAKEYFSEENIKTKLLDSAFNYAINYSYKLLVAANNDDYSNMNDTWNLDVGPNAITLTARVKIDKKKHSGSRNPLYLNIQLKDSTHKIPLHFNMIGRVKYTKGDVLYSYYHIKKQQVDENEKYSFYISKEPVLGIHDEVIINQLIIEVNGELMFKSKNPIYLDGDKPKSTYLTMQRPIFIP